jgi:hypothetical protein
VMTAGKANTKEKAAEKTRDKRELPRRGSARSGKVNSPVP